MSNDIISNYDLIEDLFNYIKNPETSLSDVIEEHGGSSFYIPSYKTTLRNDKIIKYYRENYGKAGVVRYLAKEYKLTVRQIYDITKEVRTPAPLF